MQTLEAHSSTNTRPSQSLRWPDTSWHQRSIQIRLLIPLLLLLLLSLIGTTGGFLYSTNATRDSIIKRQLDEDARQLTTSIHHSESDALQSARLLANVLDDDLIHESVYAENLALEMYDKIVRVRDRFALDQVIVLNAEGYVRANIAGAPFLESIAVRNPELLPACASIQEQLASYQETTLLIACAPVIVEGSAGESDMVVGYVYTLLDLQALLKRIRRSLELASQPRLVSVHGINQTEPTPLPPVPPEEESVLDRLHALENLHVRTVGVDLGDESITLELNFDAQHINAIVISGLYVMVVSSFLAILLSVLVALLSIRRLLIAPLLRLTSVAEQIAAGDLTARAPVESQDEIGRLATTFNTTTGELYDLVMKLEQRVEQRTAELMSTNAHLLQEIMERKRAEEQISLQKQELQRLATVDALTNLYNRRHFFELGEHEVLLAQTNNRQITAIMLDIDHFKHINDTYGHACGDQVLRVVAQYCRNSIRDTDIVGRYGGEEFAILLPGADSQSAFTIAERLRYDVEHASMETDRGPISVTISMGIASSAMVPAAASLDALLDQADKALYMAKRAGRNRVMQAT